MNNESRCEGSRTKTEELVGILGNSTKIIATEDFDKSEELYAIIYCGEALKNYAKG